MPKVAQLRFFNDPDPQKFFGCVDWEGDTLWLVKGTVEGIQFTGFSIDRTTVSHPARTLPWGSVGFTPPYYPNELETFPAGPVWMPSSHTVMVGWFTSQRRGGVSYSDSKTILVTIDPKTLVTKGGWATPIPHGGYPEGTLEYNTFGGGVNRNFIPIKQFSDIFQIGTLKGNDYLLIGRAGQDSYMFDPWGGNLSTLMISASGEISDHADTTAFNHVVKFFGDDWGSVAIGDTLYFITNQIITGGVVPLFVVSVTEGGGLSARTVSPGTSQFDSVRACWPVPDGFIVNVAVYNGGLPSSHAYSRYSISGALIWTGATITATDYLFSESERTASGLASPSRPNKTRIIDLLFKDGAPGAVGVIMVDVATGAYTFYDLIEDPHYPGHALVYSNSAGDGASATMLGIYSNPWISKVTLQIKPSDPEGSLLVRDCIDGISRWCKIDADSVLEFRNVDEVVSGFLLTGGVEYVPFLQQTAQVWSHDYTEAGRKVMFSKPDLPISPDFTVEANDQLGEGSAAEDDGSMTTTAQAEERVTKAIELTFTDPAENFDTSFVASRTEAVNSEQLLKLNTPYIMTASAALTAVSLAYMKLEAEKKKHTQLVGPKYLAALPSDPASIISAGRQYDTLIESATINSDLSVTLEHKGLLQERGFDWHLTVANPESETFIVDRSARGTTGALTVAGHPAIVTVKPTGFVEPGTGEIVFTGYAPGSKAGVVLDFAAVGGSYTVSGSPVARTLVLESNNYQTWNDSSRIDGVGYNHTVHADGFQLAGPASDIIKDVAGFVAKVTFINGPTYYEIDGTDHVNVYDFGFFVDAYGGTTAPSAEFGGFSSPNQYHSSDTATPGTGEHVLAFRVAAGVPPTLTVSYDHGATFSINLANVDIGDGTTTNDRLDTLLFYTGSSAYTVKIELWPASAYADADLPDL